MEQSKIIFVVVMIAVAFVIGMSFGQIENSIDEFADLEVLPISDEGFVPVRIALNGTTVFLSNGCQMVFFDITDDQAYSVARGMDQSIGLRPLTHDIMKDILDTYNVKITNIRIERYENEVYYATLYMRQGNRLLELDARPSDSIALSLRLGVPIMFRKAILDERGVNTCL
jgi:bifunctional DNase/RNase